MPRFSPALARARFGRNAPRLARVGLRLRLAHHVFRAQLLEHDQVVIPDQPGGDLLRPVFPAVGDRHGDRGHRPAGLLPLPGAVALPAHPPLQRQVPGGPAVADPRHPVVLPAGGDQRRADPPVNADHGTCRLAADRGLRAGERDVPAARPVAGDAGHAGDRGQVPGQPEPDVPALRDEHLSVVPVQPAGRHVPDHEPLRAAPGPVRRFPGRVPRVEERGHRLAEVPQRLLLDRG